MLENIERVRRLHTLIHEDKITREKWCTGDGKHSSTEQVCLLLALVPEMYDNPDPKYCPASLMPAWMADLTVCIDDYGTPDKWPQVIRRYSELASRWVQIFTTKDWDFIDKEIRVMFVEEAMWYIDDEYDKYGIKSVCEKAITSIREDQISVFESFAGRYQFIYLYNLPPKNKRAVIVMEEAYDIAFFAERRAELNHISLMRYIRIMETRSLLDSVRRSYFHTIVTNLQKKVSDRMIDKILDIIEHRCNLYTM